MIVDYLVVAGGGGGSSSGGGAGGLITNLPGASLIVADDTILNIVVGAGGVFGNTNTGNAASGGNSTFNGFTAIGGGGGVIVNGATSQNGGSGGGGSISSSGSYAGGTGTIGQGYAGGSGLATSPFPSGGGGGAGGVGTNGLTSVANAPGGAGVISDITGVTTTYAQGGNGSTYTPAVAGAAVVGANNGFGGNAAGQSLNGSSGAAGIVVIRYLNTGSDALAVTGTYTYANTGGYKIYTFTGDGTIRFAPQGVSIVAPAPTIFIADFNDYIVATAPVPTLAIVGDNGISGGVTISAPAPELVISPWRYSFAITAPTPTLGAIGELGVGAQAFIFTQPATLTISGMNQPYGVIINAPAPTATSFGFQGSAFEVEAPAPTLAATGTNGSVSFALLDTYAPTLLVSGRTDVIGGIDISATPVSMLWNTVYIEGSAGNGGTVVIEAPAPELAVTAAVLAVGSVQIIVSPPLLSVFGLSTTVSTTYATWAMHTERQALSTYTNFLFNSFARFNGVMIGASEFGVFTLTGATDNGTAITGVATFGTTDFNTAKVKKLSTVYVGHRTDGELELTVNTEEINSLAYAVPTNFASGVHSMRTDVGKGLSARYWQLGVQNVAGAYFELDTIEVKPTTLTRRVGGNA